MAYITINMSLLEIQNNMTPGFYHHIRQFYKKNQGLKFVEYKHIKTRGRPFKFNDEKIECMCMNT